MKELMEKERIARYLQQFGLDAVLPDALRQHLALFRFEPDESLCLQGEEPQYLYLLVQGKVKVYTASSEGKTLLVSFMTPLGVIGEIECLQGWDNLNTVTAVTAVEAIAIRKRAIRPYLEEASFLRFLLDTVTQKFYLKSVSLSFNLLHPAEVRLASYLLSVSSGNGEEPLAAVSLESLRDAANLIGISYRHLNRVLRAFSAEGLVERKARMLTVKDRNGLMAVAGRNIYENGDYK